MSSARLLVSIVETNMEILNFIDCGSKCCAVSSNLSVKFEKLSARNRNHLHRSPKSRLLMHEEASSELISVGSGISL